MANILIICAVMTSIICSRLQFVHLKEFGAKERNTLLRQSRFAENVNLIHLTNLRRLILIRQKNVSGKCGGKNYCHSDNYMARLSSYQGLDSMTCNGWLEKCVHFDGNNTIYNGKYCISDNQLAWARRDSDSRNIEYGIRGTCEATLVQKPTESEANCHVCICQCTEDTFGHQLNVNWAISLQSVLSDISYNKVIQGVRIRTDHKMIYWEIKEKTLGCDDGVWTSFDTRNELERNKDYSVLIPGARFIKLNNVVLPHNYVATGIRFGKEVDEHGVVIIHLEVRGTELDAELQELIHNSTQWFYTKGMPITPLSDGRYTYSVNTGELQNKIIEFRNSQNMHRDLGLLTVPYLDQSDIELEESLPLTRIGLICRDCDTDDEYLVPTVASTYRIEVPENKKPIQQYLIPSRLNSRWSERVSAGSVLTPELRIAAICSVTILMIFDM